MLFRSVVISDVFTNPAMRVKMMEKRMRKLDALLASLPEPELEGPADAVLTLVGWGSTYQVLLEAQEVLGREGVKVNIFAPKYLYPFKGEATAKLLSKTKMMLAIEANYTGQITKYIRMESGVTIQHHLHKYDGEPFEIGQVVDYIKQLIAKKPTTPTVGSLVSDEGLPADFTPIPMPGAEAVRVH